VTLCEVMASQMDRLVAFGGELRVLPGYASGCEAVREGTDHGAVLLREDGEHRLDAGGSLAGGVGASDASQLGVLVGCLGAVRTVCAPGHVLPGEEGACGGLGVMYVWASGVVATRSPEGVPFRSRAGGDIRRAVVLRRIALLFGKVGRVACIVGLVDTGDGIQVAAWARYRWFALTRGWVFAPASVGKPSIARAHGRVRVVLDCCFVECSCLKGRLNEVEPHRLEHGVMGVGMYRFPAVALNRVNGQLALSNRRFTHEVAA